MPLMIGVCRGGNDRSDRQAISRDGIMRNVVQFTVQFDSEVWSSLTNDERQEWVDRVVDAINDEAYTANVKFEGD